jgi:hypothetical protein
MVVYNLYVDMKTGTLYRLEYDSITRPMRNWETPEILLAYFNKELKLWYKTY